MKILLALIMVTGLGACSVVTTPIKVAATAVETTVDTATTVVRVTGKVVDLAADTKDVVKKADDVARN
ncbi:hypothetical protein [Kordiimonas lacus]|uniref:BON domain-containing protein n=1 Tax=Kordiimonas lacus TaxID=637679 RepID=A0A1G7DCW0_9PROT|nr:hypothetical protein [Kordiimonas lacus]SDE49444.1 hypothetical protein SAMN04488071_3057 [Kordiimonas lacus]